ncbi:MAG TPA: sugar phosphate isomerase/epimerase [Puia sp.]|jgi:sugar phosphate isomerase/epimerase|nr:sugar phosphate isomerase/epimerase [Puia sp.]
MSSRREFLKLSGAAAFGGLVVPAGARAFFQDFFPRAPHAIGLQLFTFFTTIDQDVPGTLQKIAAIGYKEIESAFSMKGGYYGMKPKEFAALVSSLGMTWTSHHVLGAPFHMPANAKPMVDANGKPIVFPPMRNLTENMQVLVDEAAEGGVPYLVCANIPTKSTDEIKSSIETLNKTGEACKKAGITLAYHNHTEEFVPVDGKTPYDLFLGGLTPDIKMELDLCWATKAGVDPVELFKAHPGRFPLWHVKDLNSERTGPAPVGTGVVDFKRIFDNADVAGMKHFFVEHDMPKDAFASITTSYNNLSKLLNS